MENKNRQHIDYQPDAFEELFYGTFFGGRRVFEDQEADGNDDSEETSGDFSGSKPADSDFKGVQGEVLEADAEDIQLLDAMKKKMFNVNLQTDLFSMITLPSLPRNYASLMAPIEWPKKARRNVNNQLLIDPRTIDRSDADDVALQCFGEFRGNDFSRAQQMKMKMTLNPEANVEESLAMTVSEFRQFIYESMHGLINEDTASGSGVDINPPDNKGQNDDMEKMSTDIVKAITTYVTRTITIMKPLFELVSGQGASSVVRELAKKINTANSAGFAEITKWIKEQSTVLKEIGRDDEVRELRKYKDATDAQKDINKLFGCICVSNAPAGIQNKSKYLAHISAACARVTSDSKIKWFLSTYTRFKTWDDFESIYKGTPIDISSYLLKPMNINASLAVPALNRLNESDDDEEKNDAEVEIDYDKLYQDIYHQIAEACSAAVGERSNWTCMKDLKERFTLLRESYKKEFTDKINIVCRMGEQSSKFKKKFPFRASGMISLLDRYLSELDNRADNRIKQITGTGTVSSGCAEYVEDLIIHTYPAIVAMMLTYRCMFSFIAWKYRNGYVPSYSLDNVREIISFSKGQLEQSMGRLGDIYDQQEAAADEEQESTGQKSTTTNEQPDNNDNDSQPRN